MCAWQNRGGTMFRPSVLVTAVAALLAAGAAQAQQSTLVFTAIPDEDETRVERGGHVLHDLAEELVHLHLIQL